MRNVRKPNLAPALVLLAPLLYAAEPPVRELKELAFGKRPEQARALFESSRPAQSDLGPEWLAAMSWVGRAGAIAGDWQLAEEYAAKTLAGAELLLASGPLDEDPEAPLPIALGAAIETLGKVHVARGERDQAVAFLREQLRTYAGASVETRLNKNLLLLDLEGKPMPTLDTGRFLGPRRFESGQLKGSVALFFFWAHWCSDCRAQKPILRKLEQRYANQGLRIVAPTRLYGYMERGRAAAPEQELAYLEAKHLKDSALLQRVPVPLSSSNFVAFGVSTTPTLVLVDREGVVHLYHPGFMNEAALTARINALL